MARVNLKPHGLAGGALLPRAQAPEALGRRVDVTSGDEPVQAVLPVQVKTAEEAREALRAMGVDV